MAAEGGQARDHVIAGRDVGHVGPDGFHHACRLVSQHDGQPVLIKAFDEVQIAVANASGGRPNEDFTRTGFVDLNVFDDQRLADLVQHGGFHEFSP